MYAPPEELLWVQGHGPPAGCVSGEKEMTARSSCRLLVPGRPCSWLVVSLGRHHMGVGIWLPVSLSAAPGARSGEGFKEGAAPSDPEPRGGKGRENTNQEGHKGCRSQEVCLQSQEGRQVEAIYVAPACGPVSQRSRPSVFLRPCWAVYKVQEETRTLPPSPSK